MNSSRAIVAVVLFGIAAPAFAVDPPKVFAQENRVAWCIVPFDAKKRSPEERADMLKRLGFTKYAYDWRAEHLPTFERELIALQKHEIELTAVWFPGALNNDAKVLLAGIEKFKLKTQLWVMITDPAPGKDHAAKVKAAAEQIAPIADAAAKLGCKVGLYNHGGWGGEPENLIEVIKVLDRKNVGIVYNQHHGHEHLDRFDKLLPLMMPHLYCLNLNGMMKDGDKTNQKIMVLGTGLLDRASMIRIEKSGYRGSIGLLGHTQDDAESRLRDNQDGLNWLLKRREFEKNNVQPAPRTGSVHGIAFRLTQNSDGKLVALAKPEDDSQKRVLSRRKRTAPIEPWTDILAVYVDTAASNRSRADRIPIIGDTYWLADGSVQFTSKYPVTAGTAYVALLDLGLFFEYSLDTEVLGRLQANYDSPPADRTPKTTLEKVFPTAETLPENTLRLYLQFSGPMARGDAYKHIKLFRENGKQVIDPFLELDEELWSGDGKRFTLFFDPGRVKRGLKPREEMGPALEENGKYTLVIDAKWDDENGAPLKGPYRKSFSVGPPDDAPIDPAKWKLVPPVFTDSKATPRLTVAFEKSLDVALAKRMLSLVGPDGKRIDAEVTVTDDGKNCWLRTPKDAWPLGEYKLVIDTRLEDPCGNRVGRAFEIDVFKPVTKAIEAKTVERTFAVK